MTEDARASLVAPLPWQLDEWERLSGSIRNRRLHHGVLLGGPAGIGKRLLCERLAAAILCGHLIEGEPCGRCKSCLLIRAGTHPDLLRIVPEEPGKQIRINQIRAELGEFVMRTSSVARAKVVVIDPADAMNHNTANCLLKSLEEPAADTHLLLISDAPARLLATVRSRCKQLRLRPPAPEQGLKWLKSIAATEDPGGALELACGCPVAALNLLRDGGLGQFERVAELMFRAAEPGAWIPALVSEYADLDLRVLLGWIFVFLLDFSRSLATNDPTAARLRRATGDYVALSSRSSAHHVARVLQRTVAARRDAMSTSNPNRQLLLEALMIDWQRGFVGRAGKNPDDSLPFYR